MTHEDEVQEVVRQELERLGIDPSDAAETRADMVFGRRSRKMAERVGLGVRLTLIGAAVGAIIEGVRFAWTGEW